MSDLTLNEVFAKAAKGALVEWGIEGEVDDLVQELHVWYLERPTTRQKMEGLSDPERIVTAKRAAHQMISGDVLAGNLAGDKVIYSTDSIREALYGLSTNKYLLEILPDAKDSLQARNEKQAEALRSRYDDGVVPDNDSAEHSLLRRAVRALADEVNVLYLTSDDRGVGRRDAASPNTRRATSGHSDPTSGIALMLIDNPEERDAFYEDDDLEFDYVSEDAVEFPANIMDSAFNGASRSEMYRALVAPELFPNEQPMLVQNWSAQDREMFGVNDWGRKNASVSQKHNYEIAKFNRRSGGFESHVDALRERFPHLDEHALYMWFINWGHTIEGE